MKRILIPAVFLVPLIWLTMTIGNAQPAEEEASAAADRSEAPASTGDGEGDDGSASAEEADAVLDEILRQRRENPLIEPARPVDAEADGDAADARSPAPGVAPNAERTQLLREGTFIVMRRARLIRTPGGVSPWMMTFESDRDGLADPPMHLLPCQLLEDAERLLEERGDGVVFNVSGQVYVYHDRNYLMPTLMTLAADRTNLQP